MVHSPKRINLVSLAGGEAFRMHERKLRLPVAEHLRLRSPETTGINLLRYEIFCKRHSTDSINFLYPKYGIKLVYLRELNTTKRINRAIKNPCINTMNRPDMTLVAQPGVA